MRRATWILWLLLALLPLRSWAAASMGLPQLAAVTAGAVQDEAAAHSAAMPPCHQAAADDGSASTSTACQSCDWCHAALGLAPRVDMGSMPSPSDPPAVQAERDTGRAAIDGLERPPRADLA